MKTTEIYGHDVHWQATLFGKVYFFATDVNGETYMLKLLPDNTVEIL